MRLAVESRTSNPVIVCTKHYPQQSSTKLSPIWPVCVQSPNGCRRPVHTGPFIRRAPQRHPPAPFLCLLLTMGGWKQNILHSPPFLTLKYFSFFFFVFLSALSHSPSLFPYLSRSSVLTFLKNPQKWQQINHTLLNFHEAVPKYTFSMFAWPGLRSGGCYYCHSTRI